ncbi:unnamed protein product [Paramecium pentaurelia]|uniref:Protein kinase domain-containing protein n=1 Tax=Paramecium pentaurelia TaxID=43138 RepID=A0A8S1VDT4_9CILI|nr:unnamed protein product [Paramecium pentaurelia]
MDQIDYSQVRFSFIGTRKHLFKDKQYHVYVFDDSLLMGIKPNTQNPKYYIKFGINIKFRWTLKKTKEGWIIESFYFPYKKSAKPLFGSNYDLQRLKEFTNLKVTFENMNELYQQFQLIGQGSSGKVFSAIHTIEQKIYAIKSIKKKQLKSQLDYNQGAFKMQVSILKLLAKYPDNFITLKEIYEGEDMQCLVTTFLEGPTLIEEFERLKTTNQKRFSSLEVKIILKKLLINLATLHQNRIIHRDLKPENLMFKIKGDRTTLILVDFGLATYESFEMLFYPKCGTPGYVAPEIFNLKSTSKYSTKVDIFSCGCIFYKLLTGNNIFYGETFDEVLRQNKKCQIDFNLPIDQDYITEYSINLLQKMLLKNPINRINAFDALNHPYFRDINTNIYPSLRSLQFNEEIYEDEEINNEKREEDNNYIQLPKTSRKCQLIWNLSFFQQNSQKTVFDTNQFIEYDHLSGLRFVKVNQSPFVSQVLE